ncbi:MAG TPA: NAD(P)H-hydrate dehydratase [Candidatus Angelobacter sp.]|nr:NAD(P)H-hydrate dehydratase [Candidatus Angelobacter sp.]
MPSFARIRIGQTFQEALYTTASSLALESTMKIVTAAEMREIDRLTTEKYGVPSLTLMENAGTAVAEFAEKHFDFSSVCVVCGKGNNGGDGYVAARKLHQAGKQVSVIILAKSGDDLHGDAAEMFKKLPVTPLWVSEEPQFDKLEVQQALKAELIVDAILGTGFKPPLRGIAVKAIHLINEARSPVLAVDLPSGYDADEWWLSDDHARADAVVTFTAPKRVHLSAPLTRGPMIVAPIGTPETAIESSLPVEWAGSYRHLFAANRSLDANKGEFGHLFVIGGSLGKSGAPSMTSLAALKVGAGLVTACVPRSILSTVAQVAPEVMTEPLEETNQGSIAKGAVDPTAKQKSRSRLVLGVGPGLSTNPETTAYVRSLVTNTDVPVILDADGINAFTGQSDLLDGRKRALVLTPHPGEMSRLAGLSIKDILSDPAKAARDFALQHHLHLVLKTFRTVIARPDGSLAVSTTGNPGMAKGGTGDVLTGLIAGMVAQGRAVNADIGNSICAAVDIHGLAGDFALADGDEHTLMATDIIKYLPRAFHFMRSEQKFTWLRGFPRRL